MDAFDIAVTRWHDFYLMVGGACATLLGLLFLSVSLRPEAVVGEEAGEAKVVAGQAFGNFLTGLTMSVIFLVPSPGPLVHGLSLSFIGWLGLSRSLGLVRVARHEHARGWGRGSALRAVGASVACYLAIVAVAATVLLGRASELAWLTPVVIVLILEASRNAWALLASRASD
jgi:hypothetical protein